MDINSSMWPIFTRMSALPQIHVHPDADMDLSNAFTP